MWSHASHGYNHALETAGVYDSDSSKSLRDGPTVATPLRHNNRSAEVLAVVRRGPFAKPTATEQLEYLFTRVPKKDSRKDFEKHALEHVLSFQRRILAIKKCFLVRGKKTPLGIVQDYWDRTEATFDTTIILHFVMHL